MPATGLAGALAGIFLALSMASIPSLAAGTDADIRDVLERLSRQHEFRLWMSPGLQPRGTAADVESLPLAQALGRLLRDYSHVLVENDAGEILEVYVLAPGEDPPDSRVVQSPESAQLLSGVLASDALPEDIKSAILYQALANNEATRQSLRAQKAAAIDRLIEFIDKADTAQSASMQTLREQLEAARAALPPE
jgi:hypothetical protein